MSKEVTAVSEGERTTTAEVRDFEVTVDPAAKSAPGPLENLLAAYAGDYVTALRVAADQLDVGELGNIEITATGETTKENEIELEKLESIHFEVRLENTIGDMHNALEKRASLLSKTNYFVRDILQAEVDIEDGAI